MLKISSTNAAVYITLVTGEEATINHGDDKQNYYEFRTLPIVIMAYTEYKGLIRERRKLYKRIKGFIEKELNLDIKEFDAQYIKYKKMSNSHQT